MSFNATIIVRGLKGGIQALSQFHREITGDTTVEALQELGDSMVEEMVLNCPVDTGLLQSEIAVTEVTNEKLVLESPTDYAGFVNFGTWKQEPQPYFSNTAEKVQSGGGDLSEVYNRNSADLWEQLISEYKNL